MTVSNRFNILSNNQINYNETRLNKIKISKVMNNFEEIIKEKSNNELTDIFINPEEYQPEFISLVEKELVNRRIPVESLLKLKEQREEISDVNLELGEQGSQFWIVAGFIGSIFGGIWAIGAGYSYAYSKHKSKNGKEYYVYNESTRKYGRWMLTIGCIILGITLLAKVISWG